MTVTLDALAVSHLMVTGAYIFIPLQFCISLSRSPHRHNMPWRLIFCLILFAFFFFLCGFAHFLLAIGQGDTALFAWTQLGNAAVSTTTAFYLIPLIPDMFALLDSAVSKMQNETKESKSKLFTFMAFLCHEIRNPLFAITSSAECLQDTHLSQEQMEEVSSIGDSSLLMLRLVNDVLDLSKLDSGKLHLETREFDLHSLLKRLGDNMTRQVQRKHQGAVQLKCTWGEGVPQYVLGDSVRILQIVYNLLSNSCKFTSSGVIELKVEALELNEAVWEEEEDASTKGYTVTMSHNRPVAMFANENASIGPNQPKKQANDEDDQDDEEQVFSMALLGDDHTDIGDIEACNGTPNKMVVLSITVADTGIGIPPERLEDIFEPYTQAKLSDFRQHGGTGLGLSIISSLTKSMGGTVNVTSLPGEGAKFHLKLPIQLPDNEVDGNEKRNSNASLTSLNNSSSNNNNTGMNYVGELLPSDQKQVPKNFLKAQRMPFFREYSSHDLAAMAAEAEAEAVTATTTSATIQASSMIPPQQSQPPQPLFSTSTPQTTSNTPTPLFSTTPSRSPPPANGPARRSSLEFSSSGRHGKEMSVSNSFNLPANHHVVLVVDDNSVNRKILGKMLKGFGIEYRMACNGKEAVDALLTSRNYPSKNNAVDTPRFGLVLMDISMPIMGGNTAIQIIRQAKITVPIVALSANVLSEERDRTIGLGADEFHTKPILRGNLHAICERYLLDGTIPGKSNGTPNTIDTPITPLSRPKATLPPSNAKSTPGPCSGASDCESTSLQDLPDLTRPMPYGALNV